MSSDQLNRNYMMALEQRQRFVKSWMCLIMLRDGLLDFLRREVDILHGKALSQCSLDPDIKCSTCDSERIYLDKTTKEWKLATACRKICQKLFLFVKKNLVNPFNPGLNWKACNISRWTENGWELFKVFTHIAIPCQDFGPAQCDCLALLNLIINCKRFSKHIPAMVNFAEKVRKYRNQLDHPTESSMQLSQEYFIQQLEDMISLLENIPESKTDAKIKASIAEIEKMKTADLKINYQNTDELVLQASDLVLHEEGIKLDTEDLLKAWGLSTLSTTTDQGSLVKCGSRMFLMTVSQSQKEENKTVKKPTAILKIREVQRDKPDLAEKIMDQTAATSDVREARPMSPFQRHFRQLEEELDVRCLKTFVVKEFGDVKYRDIMKTDTRKLQVRQLLFELIARFESDPDISSRFLDATTEEEYDITFDDGGLQESCETDINLVSPEDARASWQKLKHSLPSPLPNADDIMTSFLEKGFVSVPTYQEAIQLRENKLSAKIIQVIDSLLPDALNVFRSTLQQLGIHDLCTGSSSNTSLEGLSEEISLTVKDYSVIKASTSAPGRYSFSCRISSDQKKIEMLLKRSLSHGKSQIDAKEFSIQTNKLLKGVTDGSIILHFQCLSHATKAEIIRSLDSSEFENFLVRLCNASDVLPHVSDGKFNLAIEANISDNFLLQRGFTCRHESLAANEDYIVRELEPRLLLMSCIEKGIVNSEEASNIKTLKKRKDRAQRLLQCLLSKNEKQLILFLACLRENECQNIATFLEKSWYTTACVHNFEQGVHASYKEFASEMVLEKIEKRMVSHGILSQAYFTTLASKDNMGSLEKGVDILHTVLEKGEHATHLLMTEMADLKGELHIQVPMGHELELHQDRPSLEERLHLSPVAFSKSVEMMKRHGRISQSDGTRNVSDKPLAHITTEKTLFEIDDQVVPEDGRDKGMIMRHTGKAENTCAKRSELISDNNRDDKQRLGSTSVCAPKSIIKEPAKTVQKGKYVDSHYTRLSSKKLCETDKCYLISSRLNKLSAPTFEKPSLDQVVPQLDASMQECQICKQHCFQSEALDQSLPSGKTSTEQCRHRILKRKYNDVEC